MIIRSKGIPLTCVAGAWLNSADGLMKYTFFRYLRSYVYRAYLLGTSPIRCNSSNAALSAIWFHT